MTIQPPRDVDRDRVFYRIVVPTDFSVCAEEAWALAQRLAAAVGAELVLVHVLPDAVAGDRPKAPGTAADTVAEARRWVETHLQEWVTQAKSKGLRARAALRSGHPGDEVVALAMDERADLIAMGTHGRGGLDRALLGSAADRVVRTAPCPVLTVRAAG